MSRIASRITWLGILAVTAGASNLVVAAEPKGTSIETAPKERGVPNSAEPKADGGETSTSLFTFDGGIDWTTAYYFRGYKVENRGFIVQPYGAAHLNLSGEDAAVSVAPYVSTWNSFHSKTGDASDYQIWNECDVTAGVDLGFGNWNLNLGYNLYLYPNASSRQTDEVAVVLSYDDSELLKAVCPNLPISLNPHVGYYKETHDRNGGEDAYLEFGLEPRYAPENSPWSFGVPIVVGTSLDGFYTGSDGHNALFGFVSFGFKAGYQLNEHLSLNASVFYQRLWAESVVAANDGAHDVVIGTVGLGFEF